MVLSLERVSEGRMNSGGRSLRGSIGVSVLDELEIYLQQRRYGAVFGESVSEERMNSGGRSLRWSTTHFMVHHALHR